MTPVPNQPKTPQKTLRVETSLWKEAQERAHADGTTLSEVIRDFLRRYVKRH